MKPRGELFACCIVVIKTNGETSAIPFTVEAQNYYEARGKAASIRDSLRNKENVIIEDDTIIKECVCVLGKHTVEYPSDPGFRDCDCEKIR